MNPAVFRFFLLTVAVALLGACAIRQPAVVTENFSFKLPTPRAGPAGGRSIAVLPFAAAPTATGQMLLYRAGELRYEHDFYNRFLAPPAQLLTGELRSWLARSQAGPVREPGAPLSSDLIVQPRLTELHADYRDVGRPRAVVAMTMGLIARDPDGNREVFERTYRREVPMREVSPTAAVEAWSRGVAEIFTQFTRDLRRAPDA